MAEQFSFAGFEPAPKPTDRLFFAVFPDPATAAAIASVASRLRSDQGLKGRPLAPDRFHITLNHLGDHAGLPPSLVANAIDAGAAVAASPFQVTFDRAASFQGRAASRPFVLRGGEGLDGLIAFQKNLGAAMLRSGLGRRVETQFTPHVTLLYDDTQVAEQPIAPLTWTVRELVLVHSLLGRTTHVPVARWPLSH